MRFQWLEEFEMSELPNVIGLISVSIIFGAMVFFSSVVAPLVFIKLDGATAGQFIRNIFPWYYLLIAGFSLIAAVVFLFDRQLESLVMIVVFIGAFLSRQILMPSLNLHRDQELQGSLVAKKKFTFLHRCSVLINAIQILLCLVVLVRLSII